MTISPQLFLTLGRGLRVIHGEMWVCHAGTCTLLAMEHYGVTTQKGRASVVIADNKDLVRAFTEEVFNRRNVAAIDEFVAANQVDHTLPPNLPANTTGTKQAIDMYLKAFPDAHITIDDIVAEGDKVAMRFTSHGTQRGRFVGLPPTRRQVTVKSYLIARIKDGKIVEQWGLDDQLGMLQQLGVIPAIFGAVFLVGVGAGMGIMAILGRMRS